MNLLISLVTWIKSFLEDRIIRLTFNNQTEDFKSINTGIPQGSPISLILFLIYIRDLFKSKNIKLLLYINDLGLIASSTSFKKNIKILEREAKELVQLGIEYSISFDIEKTDLIHFFYQNPLSLELPNNTTLVPKKLVKWLGIYFDLNLKFKEYRSIRTSEGKQMFYRINRLASITKGLSPFALRQLYLACVTSVTDYSSIL